MIYSQVAEKAAHLSERSALSDLFSIRHVDGFPSINGYRLGKSPDDKRHLQWNEINAAWGEVGQQTRPVSAAPRLSPPLCMTSVHAWREEYRIDYLTYE